jgi:hypothetical protein
METLPVVEGVPMTDAETQMQILRCISQEGVDRPPGRGRHHLVEEVRKTAAPGSQIRDKQIMEGVWSLIGQGLAYIDYSQSAVENWRLEITANGQAVVNDEGLNPADPAGYIQNLRNEVPDLSEVVESYTREALWAYNARLYRSSAVMLGVASEAIVLEVAPALARTMQEKKKLEYLAELKSPRRSYNAKFERFRKQLNLKKDSMPEELTRKLDLTMNSVGELLRVHRNDAGHPTGTEESRHSCLASLHMFVQYAKRLYAIKSHLENT